MMVSPLIDENDMIEALAPPTAPVGDSVRRLQAGATLLIVDAFDRKATRDQFLASVTAAVNLIDVVARHAMMEAVKNFSQSSGKVTRVDIETAMDQLQQLIHYNTDQCAKMAALFHQCPMDEDKVH